MTRCSMQSCKSKSGSDHGNGLLSLSHMASAKSSFLPKFALGL